MHSFKEYLSEGLIKLPPNLLSELLEFGIYWYLCSIPQDEVELLRTKHNIKPLDPSDIGNTRVVSTKLLIDLNDIPQEYINRILKKEGIPLQQLKDSLPKKTINVKIYFKANNRIPESRLAQYDSYTQTIEVNLVRFLNEKNVPIALRRLIGTHKHELTHAIQHIFLAKLDDRQIEDSYAHESEFSKSGYLASQIEFDPWIKTCIAHIESLVDQYPDKEVNKFIRYYTLASNEKQIPNEKKSVFFDNLKKVDLEKWKKACKLLSDEIMHKGRND
jgi:hypothetical protein